MLSGAGRAILAEYYTLLLLAFLLISVRAYVRIRITKGNFQSWSWDDSSIILAWIFLLIGAILIQIEVNLGLGKHIKNLNNGERDALDILKYNTFFQMVNVLCTLVTKISISFYILRIRDDKRVRWTLATLMTFMTLATIAVILVLSLSCRPLRKLWEPELPGSCLPLTTVYNVAYVQSAFTIVIDIGLSLVPILILWNVRIKPGRKTLICTLMSLGFIATISNALRNKFQTELTTKDFTYDMTGVTVVAILELSSGIIAACIPACIPILKIRKIKGERSTAQGYSYSRTITRSVVTPKVTANSFTSRSEVLPKSGDEDDMIPLR
ncbi:hypothetical protein K458DRAFT_363270 [Lentithecium fluviatile CBS 122367]|uniref:Rhodopsin domain-containing protein n=1 Tax=Lentithecium fluviatile CBS 122367 TaxID=1168545 RepID=A0A6G1J9J6_9PLEO|nr:hypothetical protein K458DRAFT_363270 [Lentithecium fluviatile CBS 122367]